MSSQARLENVLRDIHVMISKSEVYDTDRIIVSKQDIFNLIDRLNASIYEIMDEYELTQQSRDRALREKKKEGDKIIWDASRQAEDIYAASVLYTEEALNHLNVMVDEADATVDRMYREFCRNIKQQQETIRENQLELKSQLQLLADTEKYLRLIEERNREIERERAEKKGRKTLETFGEKHNVIKPEIKINEEYFRKAGIPFEKEEEKQPEEEMMQPLEDEGVIESTLKKAAEDIQQIFAEDKNIEKNGRREKEQKKEAEKKAEKQAENEAGQHLKKLFGRKSQETETEEKKSEALDQAVSKSDAKGNDTAAETTIETAENQMAQHQERNSTEDRTDDAEAKEGYTAQEIAQAQGSYTAQEIAQAQGGYTAQEIAEAKEDQSEQPAAGQNTDSMVLDETEIFKQKSSEEESVKPHREKVSLLDKLMGKKKTLL